MLVPKLKPFFMPESIDESLLTYKSIKFGNKEDETVELEFPNLTPELINKIIKSIKKARNETLINYTIKEIVNVINETVSLWLKPDYALRVQAEKLLPIITGYSDKMVKHVLEQTLSKLSEENLWKLLKMEFKDPLVLDEYRPRKNIHGWTRAYGSDFISIILSGNAPGLPAVPICLCLLVKSGCIGKSASGDPLFPSLFAQSLSEVDKELAKAVSVVYWEGGMKDLEDIVFQQSRTVIGYGSNQSLDSIQRRLPLHVNFVRHGQKFSLALIGRERLLKSNIEKTVRQASNDIAMYDQQACMSPHVIYVEENGEISPREFAKLLTKEMDFIELKLPRGKISNSEMVAIHKLRGIYDFKSLQNENIDIYYSNNSSSWTIIYESTPKFIPSCLNRTIRILPIDNLENVYEYLTPINGMIQSVGYSINSERLLRLAESIGPALNISRFAPLGELTDPSCGWHHDGYFNLINLVKWSDIEIYENKSKSFENE